MLAEKGVLGAKARGGKEGWRCQENKEGERGLMTLEQP